MNGAVRKKVTEPGDWKSRQGPPRGRLYPEKKGDGQTSILAGRTVSTKGGSGATSGWDAVNEWPSDIRNKLLQEY